MIRNFFVNASIMISCLFILGRIYQHFHSHILTRARRQWFLGCAFGLVGVVLSFFALPVTDAVSLDFRPVPILLSALYGGLPGALLSALLVGAGETAVHGYRMETLQALGGIAVIAAASGLLSLLRAKGWVKYGLMNVVPLAVVTVQVLSDTAGRDGYGTIGLCWLLSLGIAAAAYAVLENLAKEIRVYREMEESEERYRKLIEMSPDGIFVSTSLKIVLVNDASVKLLKASGPEDLMGKSIFAFLHADYRGEINRVLAELVGRGWVLLEMKFIRHDGETIDVEVSCSRISYMGKQAMIGIFRDITERKSLEQKLYADNEKLLDLSSRDSLTGIANRRRFDEVLEREWRMAREKRLPLSLVLFDVDHFKPYNDEYGHLSGDACLKMIANTLGHSLKRSGDFVARFGGEEFVIILPATDGEGAWKVAERVREKIMSLQIPHQRSGDYPFVTVSLGVSTIVPNEEGSVRDLIEMADKALYAAKAGGRNRTEWFQTG